MPAARESLAPSYAMLGQPAPAFSTPLVSGGMVRNDALRGRWTIIEFWDLWSEDSVADVPYARALSRAAAQDRDLNFITVHVDQRYGPWNSVADFVAEEGADFPIALDPHRDVERAFQVRETPTYIVVDPTGVMRAARGPLRTESNPDGGVKSLIRVIAELIRRQADQLLMLRPARNRSAWVSSSASGSKPASSGP